MNNLIHKKFSADGRIWINFGDYSFSGQGKIELLEHIKTLGSLRKAASEMKMSYRQAWQIISTLNKLSDNKLVILKRGGKDGGTAELTEFAEEIITMYKKLSDDFEQFLIQQSEKLNEK